MIGQGISIVVPTKGRVDYVREMLLGLATAKEHSREPSQIIIVDDSSEKESELIKTLCENYGAEYIYHRNGVSGKRNFGISKAIHPIVLFVDSDCKADVHIFEEHLKCYSDETIGGCVGITEFVGSGTLASNITERMPFMSPSQFASHMEYAPWGPCTNISFRRDILNEVEGFSSFLPPKEGGEDVDLGYRVQQLGYKIRCNPNAIVSHPREALRGWGGLIERAFRWGRAETHLLSRHRANSYFDIPKLTLLFGILLVASLYKGLATHSFSLIFLPFLWLPTVALVQGFLGSYPQTLRGSWKEPIYSSISVVIDFIFELGTIFECLYRAKFSLLPLTFIYEERQLYDRWRQGMIKTWSLVISFLIWYILYIALL
ncbi:MAG: putative mycofactocin biosynthesis glycosyltransferase MftF [Syntrophomonadaceae bacterium]|nr:putative mycofactocin biosynthesis glycosyltransferase MftF [Bacillota bacterium]